MIIDFITIWAILCPCVWDIPSYNCIVLLWSNTSFTTCTITDAQHFMLWWIIYVACEWALCCLSMNLNTDFIWFMNDDDNLPLFPASSSSLSLPPASFCCCGLVATGMSPSSSVSHSQMFSWPLALNVYSYIQSRN